MPELPEVETTVRGLDKKVSGKTFVSVWSDWKGTIKKPGSFEQFEKELKGRKIRKVWRRAKNVIFELSDDYSLLIHMKMTGHLMVGKQHGKFLHLIFTLDNGQIIALSDLRKFAKAELWKTEELINSKEFLGLGPEPLEASFTLEKFKEALKHKKGKIKQVLMVPQVLAGVGNIYASEALWWAKVHPAKSTAQLTEKELSVLYNAVRKVLKDGVDFGGDSFSDYRNVDGLPGKFEGHKKVYQREGQPCSRCKTNIVRLVIATRSSFFCPKCQKL